MPSLPIRLLLLLCVPLVGCASNGAVEVIALEGGGRVVLQAFDPADVRCEDIDIDTLPTTAPLVESEALAPDPAFPNADLPSQPLTLVAVQYDDCARVGFRCINAVPGADAILRVEAAVHCPEGCARYPSCATGCCDLDATGRITSPDCDGDGLDNELERELDGSDMDTDEDGLANLCDLDSDDDGLEDARECEGLGPGVPGFEPPCSYMGVPLHQSRDADGDRLPDGMECCGDPDDIVCDVDGDALPARLDRDSDNDGVGDLQEANFARGPCPDEDCDGDGLCNALDPDSDGDGARDGEECVSLVSAESCTDPWDPGVVRCGEPVAEADYCGGCCHETARCEGTDGPAANFCIPSAGEGPQLRWTMPGGVNPDPPTVEGIILLQALLFDEDNPGTRTHRFPFMFSATARADGVFPPPEGAIASGLLEQLLVSSSFRACLSTGPRGSAQCLAVFGLRTLVGGSPGPLCWIDSDHVLVVADHFGHADRFDGLTPGQQQAIGAFDRGFQFRAEGDDPQWVRLTSSTTRVERPQTASDCRDETSQFNFELL